MSRINSVGAEIFDVNGRSDTENLLASFRNLSKAPNFIFLHNYLPHREHALSLSVVKKSNGE